MFVHLSIGRVLWRLMSSFEIHFVFLNTYTSHIHLYKYGGKEDADWLSVQLCEMRSKAEHDIKDDDNDDSDDNAQIAELMGASGTTSSLLCVIIVEPGIKIGSIVQIDWKS